MQITFFFREKNYEFSIERVFDNIVNSFENEVSSSNNYVPFIKVTLINLIKNIVFCKENKGTINHITGDIYYCILGLPSNNTVITFHDLGILKDSKGFKKLFLWFFWYYLPVKKAKYITCISTTTKNELVNSVKCNEDKIIVIHNPISNNYKPSFKTFNSEDPIILHIGTRSNKNLERVINALKEIKCTLRIIGVLTEHQTELLKENNINYSNAYRLSDDEIMNEYINCDIVSFPSLYEGFGMPIIEGQAIGRVVLTSEIEPLIEISNNSAFLVNPYDIKSIAEGFKIIISNAELRNQLILKGFENSEKFSANTIAKKYVEIYSLISKKIK
jgi:glycosyltransferase involved in cell wall biosynthesis